MTIDLYLITILILVGLLAYCYIALIRTKRRAQETEIKYKKLRTAHDEIIGEINKIANEPINPEMMDSLSGLPGRRVFEDRIQQSINHSTREKALFAVVCVDIDNFKSINELGKDIGDKVLRELGSRLQMSVRQVDTVTRYVGSCYYLLLPHLTRAETAIYVAQRIQDNLLQTFKIDGHDVTVTVSIGIAIYPIDGGDTTSLIENAAHAMRLAKQQGKNRYQFCQNDLQNLGQRELTLAHLIRTPEFFTQLQVQYKPYFNAETNKVVYVQAIPHLRDPKFGMIPFLQFANITENAGKMLELNKWLLRQSLAQCVAWKNDNFQPEYLAIPVSLRQLENAHFVYALNDLLNEVKEISVKLVLDIYDDKMPQNPIFIENLFHSLNKTGIKVTVGVIALGHFAMQKINKIPLSYLKIDSKLVEGAVAFKDKEFILNQIITLAQDENIIVIAEGIDNESQKIRLKKLGCEIMEGKAFGYLMPSGSVIEAGQSH